VVSPKLTRRRLLAAGGGLLLVVGGAVGLVRTHGYELPAERADTLQSLAPWQFLFVQAVARRIAAPDKDDGTVPSTDDVDVAGFVDRYAAGMPAPMRRDLLRLFGLVEHVLPLGSGYASRFTKLGPDEQDRVLAAMEKSDKDLLRGAFAGLKSLIFMGYYRDPRTWKILGYAGPFVGRPEKGWTG